jgi:hypothetical protein
MNPLIQTLDVKNRIVALADLRVQSLANDSGHRSSHTYAWTRLAHEFTSHASFAVSILALAVALWSGYQARRSAAATETQARVAREQLGESLAASREARTAAEDARKLALHDVNAHAMERSARVTIGVEDLKWPPILKEEPCDEADYPRDTRPDQPKGLTYRSSRFHELYFWVRGIVINGDNRPIQFIPYRGIRVIEGRSRLLGDEIKIPPKLHPAEGRYLLDPGKAALFEWRATRTIEQWIEIYNETEDARSPAAGILVFPAGDPQTEAANYIEIRLEACPLDNDGTNDEVWAIEDHGPGCAQAQPPRMVPTKARRELALALGESTPNDPRIWNLELWQRDLLDLW